VAPAGRAPVKSIYSLIWLIGALLVIATFDRIPDPPSSKPEPQFSEISVHADSVAAITPSGFVIPSCTQIPAVVADAVEYFPRTSRLVLVERAADASPPLRCQL
jgi:hypothetical protein